MFTTQYFVQPHEPFDCDPLKEKSKTELDAKKVIQISLSCYDKYIFRSSLVYFVSLTKLQRENIQELYRVAMIILYTNN